MDASDAMTLAESVKIGYKVYRKTGYGKVLKIFWVKDVEVEKDYKLVEHNGIPATCYRFKKVRVLLTNEKPNSPKKLSRTERHTAVLNMKELAQEIKSGNLAIVPTQVEEIELAPVEYTMEHDASG